MKLTEKIPESFIDGEPCNGVIVHYLGARIPILNISPEQLVDDYIYIATDEDGSVFIYSHEPTVIGDEFYCDGDIHYCGRYKNYDNDGELWYNSVRYLRNLVMRPITNFNFTEMRMKNV